MINPLETAYDLAMSSYGHTGKIDNKNTTFFVKEIISGYKTLISKTPFEQGSTCELDGIKYLVTESHQRFAQDIYYKGIIKFLQPVTVRPTLSTTGNVYTYGVIDYKDLEILSTDLVTLNQDQIRITFKSTVKIGLNYYVDFNGRTFKVQNIDDSKENLTTVLAIFYSNADTYTITLSETAKSLNVGDIYQISATCIANGEEVINPTITYSSNDETIASVSSSGLVTALKDGSTNIIATYNGVSATLNLTIAQVVIPPEEPVYTIELDTTSITLKKGSTYQLNPICKVDGVVDDNPTIIYTSSSTDVTVDTTGLITGVNEGTANITIKYHNVSKSLGVTVSKPVSSYTLTLEPDNKDKFGYNQVNINTYVKCSINPVPTEDITWSINETYFNIFYQEKAYCLITPTADLIYDDVIVKDTNGNIIATTGVDAQLRCEGATIIRSLSLPETSVTKSIDEVYQINPIVSGVDYPYCTYISNNTTIAKVDAKGLVTCLSSGTATITVKCGSKTATLSLIVASGAEDTIEIEDTITFNKYIDGTYQLSPVCKSGGIVVDNPTITYSVVDDFVTVDSNGLISIPSKTKEGLKSITLTWGTVTKTIEFIIVQTHILKIQVLQNSKVISKLMDDLEVNPTQTYNVTISSKNVLEVQIYPTFNLSTYEFSYSGDLKLHNNYSTNTRILLVRNSGGSSGTLTMVDTVSGKTIGTVNVTT